VIALSPMLFFTLTATWWSLRAPPWMPNVTPPYGAEDPAPPLRPERTAAYGAALEQGTALLRGGRYQQAQKAFSQAVSLCPKCPEARKVLARVLLTLGYLSWDGALVRAALDEIGQAAELDPRDRESRQLWRIIKQLVQRTRPPARAEKADKSEKHGS